MHGSVFVGSSVNPETNSVAKALAHEVWELPSEPSLLIEFLEKLPFCWVRTMNGEMSYTWLSRSPMVLSQGTDLSFPELGLTLSNEEVERVLVHRHPVHAGVIRLSLTSSCRSEQFVVNAPVWAHEAIAELSLRVVDTYPHGDAPGGIKRIERKLCACCRETRRKLRSQGERHPLYHLLSFASARDLALRVDVDGSMFRFGTSLCPLKWAQEKARLVMRASRATFSLDLSEVFRAVARMDVIDESRVTLIDCYHSHGEHLLSLSQEGDELFEVWRAMAKRAGVEE